MKFLQFERITRVRQARSGSASRIDVARVTAEGHRFVVIDARERIVEMMQQLPPSLILRRFSEPFLVCGDAVPAHEEKILALSFETTLEFVRAVAGHRRNDGLRFAKCGFERCRLTRTDLQQGGFENHERAEGCWMPRRR